MQTSTSVSRRKDDLGTTGLSVACGIRPRIFHGPVDAAMLVGEWLTRQIYWRNRWLRDWIKQRRSGKPVKRQSADKAELMRHLRSIGVTEGALVMAHTSTSGLTFDPKGDGETTNSLQVAQELVQLLSELLGESGTLVMPTHPLYKSRPGAASESNEAPVFNPRSTPSCVGLANEIFWRTPGTLRSLHPHNTLAARGPLAESLLEDNLTDRKPLAHGIDSGYFRFCQQNGLLVSIGVSLGSCFTLVHAAEESQGDEWSVPDFFEERRYIVRHNGVDRTTTIRKTRTEFMMFSLCIRKLRRDLVRAGILHEGHVGTIRVDWAWSGEVFDFISARNRISTYPYFGTALVPRKDRRDVARAA